jgi:Domain of unknown function (DUF1992)
VTERKPADVDFETWIDRQIRVAAERGEFDDLAGAGKPLTGLTDTYDELWWVKQVMRREGLSPLPPALRLRKDVQDTKAAVAQAGTEAQARALIEDLNERIRTALKYPVAEGPAITVAPLDPDPLLAAWRAEHAAAGPEAEGSDDGADRSDAAGRGRGRRWRSFTRLIRGRR